MSAVLVLLAVLPLGTAACCLVLPHRWAGLAGVAAGVACFVLALTLVPVAADHPVSVGFLRADALSVVFLLGTSFLYAAGATYSIGYLHGGAGRTEPAYPRRFHLGLNLFAWSMLAAPLVDGLALLWIAVEVTTVVSALLVAIDGTDRAAEAAWKYVLIASAGLGVALLATVVMYYAGARSLGTSYDLAFAPLRAAAGTLPHTPVRLAFVLAVLGFGTKVGLFPVHTWLPDAHSEAPTPVSALLSGSLLAVSFYAVLRYYQIAAGTLGPRFPRAVLLAFGVLSLLLAALFLIGQRDVKRMLAYSSIEHMGILAIGVGFGAPIALSGVLLHVIAHAAAKGNAFFGAGVLVRRYRSKRIADIRDARSALPWTAPLFLLAVLALSAMPPFGLFRSEFQIVAGGLATARDTASAVFVGLVTVAFAGLAAATTRMIFAPGEPAPARGEPSAWMVLPVLAGLAGLVLLGVHVPTGLADLLARGAAELAGGGA